MYFYADIRCLSYLDEGKGVIGIGNWGRGTWHQAGYHLSRTCVKKLCLVPSVLDEAKASLLRGNPGKVPCDAASVPEGMGNHK